MLLDNDPVKANRVTQAVLQMSKIDIANLQDVSNQRSLDPTVTPSAPAAILIAPAGRCERVEPAASARLGGDEWR
jgi:hypothetical protein